MYVVKRDGRQESVDMNKITERIERMCQSNVDTTFVDPKTVAQKVVAGLYKGVTTRELDKLAMETAASMAVDHPDYARLAGNIAVSDLQKSTPKTFSEAVAAMSEYVNPDTGRMAPMVSQELSKMVAAHPETFNSIVVPDRDYSFDFFGFKTLENGYLLKINGKPVETPQYMYLRVAIGIHGQNLVRIRETYDVLSLGLMTHATPTLFNAGTPRPQMSSCFLVDMKEDSIDGIYETLADCARISKSAGGLGLNIHCIRAAGAHIAGTNGTSNGIVPMLRVFNNTARYVDQGGGKRKGSLAVYIEPWHADIYDFLDLRNNIPNEERRARDLFYALWIPDLFMRRVHEEEDADWTLFSPDQARELAESWGPAFDAHYVEYEKKYPNAKRVKARNLWQKIVRTQVETGMPYMLYKDACNKKSNQQNLGTIKSSNLCTEIIEYTAPDEIAVCNLASIALPKFVERSDGRMYFDFDHLARVVRVAVVNLNMIIDREFYPVPEAERSNKRHRPIGLGVQGLADVFLLLRLPFTSPQARELNTHIFETIYFAALTASNELAKVASPYETYSGSPASKGILQFDMWNVKPSEMHDWATLRAQIKQWGLRNSLLVAPMPTASTSQILGNNECFEPYTSNLYTRRTLAGEFIVVNKHLVRDLIALDLWGPGMAQMLMATNGSVQKIPGIPDDIKELYRTVWEIKQRDLIDMAADRAPFIDQSMSMNVFMSDASFQKVTSMHYYAWTRGLKTGCYYLRTRPAVDPIKFTVAADAVAAAMAPPAENGAAPSEVCQFGAGGPDCAACGS